jgi:hypothetical protein
MPPELEAVAEGAPEPPSQLLPPAWPATPHPASRIDSLLPLPGGRVASRSADARVSLWGASTPRALLHSFRLPGAALGDALRGRLGASADGAILFAGATADGVLAFDAATGVRLAALPTGRARAPVATAVPALDGRTVLAAVGAVICRWELVNPDAKG